MPTFTSGNDTYTVSAAGSYDLDMLAGDDRLNVYGGNSVTAHLGLGNDLAIVKAALVNIFGDAGADRFDIYSSNAAIDGGADNDLINVRGGSGLSAHGGLGADRFNFYADSVDVSIFGDDGDDDFFGYGHQVSGTISGGLGRDYFVGFTAGITLAGGGGNDIYRATAGSVATFLENAGEGSDAVQVARGQDFTLPDNIENISVQGFGGSVLTSATLTGNALSNRIAAHNNDEAVSGLDGNDSIAGKGGSDTLNGGNGNDYLDGGTGDDTLNGDAGSDVLQGRVGIDTMAGGVGDDTYYVDATTDTVIENAGEGTDTVRVSAGIYNLPDNVEIGIVQSGPNGSSIYGNLLDNTLIGNSRVDSLLGGGGNDTIKGGGGNDTLLGGSGSDHLIGGTGADNMAGGPDDDTYDVDNLSDTVFEDAAQGIDTARVAVSGYALPDNVDNGIITISTGATLSGNAGNNELTGGAGADVLIGGDGLDQFFSSGGGDAFYGGPGIDIYHITDGDTVVENPGEGADTVFLEGVSVYTLPDNVEDCWWFYFAATVTGNADANALHGSTGNDTISGGGGDDYVSAGAGDDHLNGDGGNDQLTGFSGDDVISGGDGDDLLIGGAGVDLLTGGAGADTFTLSAGDSVPGAFDSITDFQSNFAKVANDDTLDLHGIDANSLVDGDQAFSYIGSNAFTGTAGELRASFGKDGSACMLYGDVDGDGIADFQLSLHLTGTGLYAEDMVL